MVVSSRYCLPAILCLTHRAAEGSKSQWIAADCTLSLKDWSRIFYFQESGDILFAVRLILIVWSFKKEKKRKDINPLCDVTINIFYDGVLFMSKWMFACMREQAATDSAGSKMTTMTIMMATARYFRVGTDKVMTAAIVG